MKFEEFPFADTLQRAVSEMGFVDCTAVQEQSFNAYYEGKDIYAQSQTGTGKTAAFMLCGLQELLRRNQANNPAADTTGDTEAGPEFVGNIKMLILSPTRELAQQIEEEAQSLGQFLPVQIAAFYGGVGYEEQRAHLDSGVQIITGTPGRIIDLAKSGELPLEQVQIMVLDEADRMLDMGFIEDVRWVMSKLPAADKRLTMLYSATLNAKVGNLTWEFMRSGQIAEIIIEPEQITTENVEQELYHVSNQEKLRLLLSLVRKYDPESAIIFCNTKSGATFLEGRLRQSGYQVKALMGDLPQARRTQIVGQLKAGKLRIVVATDVASRGLHIEGLPLVINYDLPDESENYVHRIGRTARAGAKGRAISLACERYVYNLADIERFIDSKIPVSWFPEEELVEVPRFSSRSSPRGSERGHRGSRDSRDFRGARNPGGFMGSGEGKGSSREGRDNRPERPEHGTASPGVRSSRYGRRSEVYRGRNGGSGSFSGRASQGKEPPKDKEERLKYYQQKYGENFGAEGSSGNGRTGNPNRHSSGPSRQQGYRSSTDKQQRTGGQGRPQGGYRAQRSDRTKQNGSRGPQNIGSNNGSRRSRSGAAMRPDRTRDTGRQNPVPQAPAAPDKRPGLWQRLFGRR